MKTSGVLFTPENIVATYEGREDSGMNRRGLFLLPDEVRGIVTGKKTQICFPISPQPEATIHPDKRGVAYSWASGTQRPIPLGPRRAAGGYAVSLNDLIGEYCPYGQPGQQLWGKEAWMTCGIWKPSGIVRGVQYEADGTKQEFARDLVLSVSNRMREGWQPARFMPQWAARVVLTLTDVQALALHDLKETDALAQGITAMPGTWMKPVYKGREEVGHKIYWWPTAREAYFDRWDARWKVIEARRGTVSLRPRLRLAADCNPFVWKLTFKRALPATDRVEKCR